jgi:hypothetical protein
MSLGGASIWEDASARGDSPEPEMPLAPPAVRILEDRSDLQATSTRIVIPEPDPEAYENMPVVGKTWRERERDAYGLGEKLSTPRAKGLEVVAGNRMLGTRGSLYDRDGFLKD